MQWYQVAIIVLCVLNAVMAVTTWASLSEARRVQKRFRDLTRKYSRTLFLMSHHHD